ncbi:unnamed protein product [Soboliphyme baturini]|uniref:Glyco_18 domain-containing protein n=1 Tax=Soboliphyme baturini TaxID=241478 RepID=A0A183IQQ4_9BILA|nr:unnamed protein product [Soboliphyme baturini]
MQKSHHVFIAVIIKIFGAKCNGGCRECDNPGIQFNKEQPPAVVTVFFTSGSSDSFTDPGGQQRRSCERTGLEIKPETARLTSGAPDDDKAETFIRGCYFTNWAQYRPGTGKYEPSHYIPGLCTHIFYAFAWMNENYTVRSYEWNDESTAWSKGLYELMNDHKRVQPDLKTLLLFKSMSASKATRQVFIDSTISFVRSHNFDGFDLDWEYPDTQTDKDNFILLIQEMSDAFKLEGTKTGRPRLLLTAAVAAGYGTIIKGYDVKNVAK